MQQVCLKFAYYLADLTHLQLWKNLHMRIMVVEDDKVLGAAMEKSLRHAGFAVDWVQSAQAAIQFALLESFDLLVLDLGLPDDDGYKVIQKLRDAGRSSLILIVSARDSVEDRIKALDQGADDYVVKPVAMTELHARVRAMLRRRMNIAAPSLALGRLKLDINGKRAAIAGRDIELSGREWAVLEYLIANAGRIVSKDQIIQAIACWDEDLTPNAIEAYVHRLRSKIDGSNINIRTVRGLGYLLEDPARCE
jgi:two-component system, OmpR family, response regulator